MIEALFNQTNYAAAKSLLDLTSLRSHAIASNIANLETPHYKRIDVSPSFSDELRKAVASKDLVKLQSLKPQLTIDTTARASSLDGNTVELESELLSLQQNALAHAMGTQLVSGSILRMKMAITGRP